METVDYFPIEVEQTDWQASSKILTAIRLQVFVEEQEVPESEEIDEYDATALHWLAYGPNDEVMATARMLSDGQVGRMAVLKGFRQQGVGSSLMRNMIRYAVVAGIKQLFLNAQIKAIPFYEGLGFITQGNPFMDAGISHKYMYLNLHNYIDNSPQSTLAEITEEERQRTSIEGVDAFLDQGEILIQRAQRDIRIFSHRLEPSLYSNNQVCDALYTFATSHPMARVRILVKDIHSVINHPNLLHELCNRLPSRIKLKKFHSKEPCLHTEFMLIDRVGILYKQEPIRFVGYATQHAPMDASSLAEEFDSLWGQGEIDPELKRLNI